MSLTKKELLLVLTLAFAQFTHILDFMIIMPLGPHLMQVFGITTKQFSLVVSAYTLSAGVSGFLSSFFVDRFDRKRAFMAMYIGFLVGTLGCGLAPGYEALLLARVLAGFFGGVLGGLVLSIVGDSIPIERRGTAMGIVMVSFSLASVLGIPIGLFLAKSHGWNAPFLALSAVGLLVLMAVTFWIPPVRSHMRGREALKESPFALLREIVTNPNQIMALSLIPVLMLGHFVLVPFLNPYLVANVGFKETELSYVYVLGGAVTFVVSPMIGKLSDRIGSIKVFTAAMILALVPALWVTHLGHVPLAIALVATTFFFALGNARYVPAQVIVSTTVPPARRGGFMSVNSSVQQLAAGFASLMAGWIVGRNEQGEITQYGNLFFVTALASLVCIWLARKIRPLEQLR